MIVDKHNKKNKFIIYLVLGLLLILAVVSRIWVLDYSYNIEQDRLYQPDSVPRYEIPALHLLHTGSLAINPEDKETKDLAQGPGYALMIAGVYKLWGEKNHYAFVLLQIAISALTIWIVYLTGAYLWSPLAGLFAAAFMVFSPMQSFYAFTMLTEVPFSLFAVLSILFGVKLLSSSEVDFKKWAFLLGLALAFATLFKTLGMLMSYVVIAGIVAAKLFSKLLNFQNFSWKMVLQSALLIILPIALIIGGWTLRNGQVTGAYIYTDNMGTNLLDWRASNIVSVRDGIPIEDAQKQLHGQLQGQYSTLAERVEKEKKLSKDVILSNLDVLWAIASNTEGGGAYGTIMDTGMTALARYLNDRVVDEAVIDTDMQRENMKQRHLWFKLLDLGAKLNIVMLYLLAAVGFFIAIRLPGQQLLHIFIMGSILYYWVTTFGHEGAGYSRGRMTFVPFVMLYAGYAVAILYEKTGAYFQRRQSAEL